MAKFPRARPMARRLDVEMQDVQCVQNGNAGGQAPEAVLDDLVCFALYAASRAVTVAYRPLLEDLGLTYPQYLVMTVLWRRGPMTVKELGETLHLDYGTLTPLLKRLDALDVLTRHRRAEDERSVLVELTDRGRSMQPEGSCVPPAMSELMGLDEEESQALRAALRRLAGNVSRPPEEG